MKSLRTIITITLFWVYNVSFAQNTLSVGAIIETQTHLWVLDSVCSDKSSTSLYWAINDKGYGKPCKIPHNIYLKNLNTGEKFPPASITPKNIRTKKYDVAYLIMTFPVIGDSSTFVSVYSSDNFYIDSLYIPHINEFILNSPKYKVPIYSHKHLISKQDSIEYSDSLFNKGMSCYYAKNYQRAITFFKLCYAFDKLLDNYQWLSSLKRERNDYDKMWLAHCFYLLGNEDIAKKYDQDYKLEPYDRKLVEKSDFIYNQYRLSSHQLKAVEYSKICAIDSATFGGNHHRYALSLYELGQVYSSLREFERAKELFLRGYDIIRYIDDTNWLAKSLLYETAKIEHEKGNVLSAIHYLEQSLGINNNNVEINDDYSLLSKYDVLANYYVEIGNWDKVLEIEGKRVEYFKAKTNNWGYYYTLGGYAMYLAEAGYYKQALRIYRDMQNNSSRLSTELEIGDLYYNIRDYKTALNYYIKAIENYKDTSLLFPSIEYSSLAACYAAMNNIDNAIQIQKIILAKEKLASLSYSNLYNGYISYLSNLSDLAYYFNLNEQFDSALVCEKKSLELKEKYYSPNSIGIAFSHYNIGISYGGKGIWDEAIKHTLLGYDIYKKQERKEKCIILLSLLSKYAFKTHNYDYHISYVKDLLSSVNEDLLSTFRELTYNERVRYIDYYSNLLNDQIPMYAYYVSSDTLTSLAYDATLLIKGALLNSENGVRRVIDESDNPSLKNLWEELRADRYILSKQLEKDSLERKVDVDSLQKVIYNLEDSLIVKCKAYDDITKSMKIKWFEVQKGLSSQDIAIEFLRFPVSNDSIMYVALTLRKDSDVPKMIKLFEEKQLKQVSDTSYYQCRDMFDLIWEPLRQELQGIKNIYFSPSGALYNIGIEYLPRMENYNIYRLSSTRELVTRIDANPEKRAVLYGGLDYDAALDTLSKPKSIDILDYAFVNRANVEAVQRRMKIRGGQEKLKHSKEEVEQIGETFRKAEWTCVLDTAAIGTEESFKSLSGRHIGCLHIATHGFYYTPEEADDKQYRFMKLDNQHASTEDKALTRSGLLLSGANHILEEEAIPDNVEDGVLTAKEIADVDLRGLDLVVLSACQTGLGDLSQGEGVFGLQRGFKKAGAKSILMSLWEVEDEASQILMTQFYKNLLAGQGKRQALLSSQKYLREYEGGKYDVPKYWAAFILLDGL